MYGKCKVIRKGKNMGYNNRYWDNKMERAEQARLHTKVMYEKFGNEIEQAISNTIEYTDNVEKQEERTANYPRNIVVDTDSVDAIFKYIRGKTCVLNFASYLNPGGKFIEGSKAQEECLCHSSFLYNVLKGCTSYYNYNAEHRNKGLYTNRALYTPNIIFLNDKNETVLCDVLTCAAPNRSALMRYVDMDYKCKSLSNDTALRDRIAFIRDIVEKNNVDTFIAGAYGCGVFGQAAYNVATLFKKTFDTTTVKNMVYAIPSKMDEDNYSSFLKVFGG